MVCVTLRNATLGTRPCRRDANNDDGLAEIKYRIRCDPKAGRHQIRFVTYCTTVLYELTLTLKHVTFLSCDFGHFAVGTKAQDQWWIVVILVAATESG